MPNIITHKLFAEQVKESLKNEKIKKLIEDHEHLFYIGSNGPDILFFHNAKPWQCLKKHDVAKLGNRMHSHDSNAFYQVALHCIKNQNTFSIKESMLVYLFGHLCHWALDKTTHPFIFYFTGVGSAFTSCNHSRFESMLDTILLKNMKGLDISQYKCSEICDFDQEMLKAIARIYVPCAKQVYDFDLKVHDLRIAIQSWGEIQNLLYDPKYYKYNILKPIEKIMRAPWSIRSHIVLRDIDEQFDILNENHNVWIHPCDDSLVYTTSFMDLFEKAIDIACQVIEKAFDCIEYNADDGLVLDYINNESYDTGLSQYCKMKYFNIIYDEDDFG